MKKTLIAILAVVALMSYGQVLPLAHAAEMAQPAKVEVGVTGDTGTYQGGTSQDLAKQDMTKQDMAKQDMTKHDMAKDESIAMKSCSGAYDLRPLLDKDVKGTDGHKLGTIKDFVVDPGGHVFAIISSADSERTVAIPFESFVTQRTVSLNLNKDQLASVPEFNLASADNRYWSEDIYRQLGIQPSWSSEGKTGAYGAASSDQELQK